MTLHQTQTSPVRIGGPLVVWKDVFTPQELDAIEGSEGGHYNWHVDLGKATTEPRKISLSLQLSDRAQYEGRNLVLEAGDGAYLAERSRG